MEALFDCFAKYSKTTSNQQPPSSSTGAAPTDKGKSAAPDIVVNPGMPQQSAKANRPAVNPVWSSASGLNVSSGLANDNLRLNDNTLRKFVFFSKLQHAINASSAPLAPAAAAVPAQPSFCELNITLHKWLPMVPKMEVNGIN
ncbi:hypothetical protein PTTG_00627 [Puccinia triticina 1-1 BBBD Race 1]|uniref:Uncharacterized protein n=1 Tax=Puccinia triticina (isolate 1-1 / race 1 (BBBD)) TaxID=630390 RepID=A0A0C4EIR0_PUCT1|nr:hypothetical protein PTTG_00627 [Puccinia triticina 1-1 BBBD Race 1]